MLASQPASCTRPIHECVSPLTISAGDVGRVRVVGAVRAVVGAAGASIASEHVAHSALDAGSCVGGVAVQAVRLSAGVTRVVVGQFGVRAGTGGALRCR